MMIKRKGHRIRKTRRSKSLSYLGRRHIPLPTGRFVVGCLDIMTSYSRSGVFMRLFYPAQEESIAERYLQWPHWIPSKEYLTGYGTKVGVSPGLMKIIKFIFAGDVFIPAVWHASLSKEKFRYPVIIFSHGLGACRTSYSTICLEMASHGFIVASLEHRDHSACTTFYKKQARMSFSGQYPASYLNTIEESLGESEEEWMDVVNGRWEPRTRSQFIGPHSNTTEWIYYEKVQKKAEISARQKQLQTRVNECIKAIDFLECLDRGKATLNVLDENFRPWMFKDRLDMTKVAVAGHSFGGTTTILSLAMEKRFKVGIALDPWMFPFQNDQSSFSMGHQPLLVINMERFQDDGSLRTMSALQRKEMERKFFTVRKAHHADQSDVNFAGRRWLYFFQNVWNSVDRFTVIDLTSRLMLDFLGRHLDVPVSGDYLDAWCKREKYLREDFCS